MLDPYYSYSIGLFNFLLGDLNVVGRAAKPLALTSAENNSENVILNKTRKTRYRDAESFFVDALKVETQYT